VSEPSEPTEPTEPTEPAKPAEPAGEPVAGEPAHGLDEREYSLIEHLTDLRVRVQRALLGVGVVSMACFAVAEDLLKLLRLPMDKAVAMVPGATAKFIVISPAEYFIAQLKAAVVAGIFLSMPWSLYQLWLFIAPGLYAKERRYVVGFCWAGAFFFMAGGAFAYYAVFPGMFKFFVANTMDAGVDMTLSVQEHFGFSLKLLLAFGAVFQAPVIVFVLSVAGIVNPRTLGKYRSYVVVLGFVLGALLTPPDVISQTLLALPLIVLFEFGLIAAKFATRNRPKPGEETEALAPTDDSGSSGSSG
jgi:sec-independent protein translocase protein TatC